MPKIYKQNCKQCKKYYESSGQYFCSYICFTKNNKGRHKPPEERFWKKVNKNSKNGCWEWFGCVNKKGYGGFYINGNTCRVHRFSYELKYGKIPNNLHVLHHCDNPPCVNPNHLFLGTPQDNVMDRCLKGRSNASRGEKQHSSKLISEQVIEIRKLYKDKICTRIQLVKKFNVSYSTICQIIDRRIWNHI
ncbi:MAG: HNH endonuclease signature motif containing protein [Nanoarchaeota archaeon]